MKAVRIHLSGDARVEDVQPPATMQDNEVLVRIFTAGVNRRDFAPGSAPRTPGLDFSGQVLEVGARAKLFSRGERVFGFAEGSYAEYAVIPARSIARMPKSVDYEAAAALPTPGLTAYQVMMHEVQVEEDEIVLVHGAGSTVGVFAVQLALWQGARVIAVASGEDAAYLRSIGVEQVIDYRRERFDKLVDEVDAVVDLVGGDALQRSYGLVRPGGILVTTAGTIDDRVVDRNGIRGVQFELQHNGSQLAVLARLVDERILTPMIGRVLRLDDASLARELMMSHAARGSIVLSVSPP